MTDASFSVNITNDNILERKEEFNLAIDQRSLPFVVTAIDPSQVTVTIMDDDSGKQYLSSYMLLATVCKLPYD